MRKMILTGLLVTLFNFTYAMDTHLDTSIERQDHSSIAMRTVETREIGSLLVSQINVDSFRTIIRDAVTDVLGDRLPPDTESMVDTAIRVAARGVEREHITQMRILAIQAQAEIDRREDAHEHELADREARQAETEKQRVQAEKINTLRGILLHIPVTDKNPIMLRAANLIELDILERHKKVDELYKRFLPYSELFGRTDLDVVATSDDLDAVRYYVNETVIAPLTAVEPPKKPYLVGTDYGWGNRGGDVEWNNGRRGGSDHGAWVNPALVGWLNGMGEDNFTKWWWNKYAPSWPGEQLNAAVGRAMSTYNGRLATYQSQKSQHESQVEHAKAMVFPSESFNRLVDQVNRFFTEGLQDAH